jgi:hypothetical protein
VNLVIVQHEIRQVYYVVPETAARTLILRRRAY